MLTELESLIDALLEDQMSLKPYFIEAFIRVSLAYYEKYKEINSKLKDYSQIQIYQLF